MHLLTLDRSLAEFTRAHPTIIASVAAAKPTNTMYLAEKPRGVDFYNNSGLPSPPQPQQQMLLGDSSGDDHEVKAPKKRAETWIQEETRSLISFRREIDGFFNTSKSNKHLWEQISAKMREKGFDRSPTMCTDKWRNLLKEFKKAKHQSKGSGSAKMSYYKELDELLKERSKKASFKSSSVSKVDTYLQFPDKGLEDANTPFGSVEVRATSSYGGKVVVEGTRAAQSTPAMYLIKDGAMPSTSRSPLNLDRTLEHDRHPLAITAADAVAANSVPPWNWRDASVNDNSASYVGRVILVKWGDFSRKLGVDGTADAIKEAIKSAFGLRTKRAFWLEDEDNVVRSFDREMPLGSYTLHLDEAQSTAAAPSRKILMADNASETSGISANPMSSSGQVQPVFTMAGTGGSGLQIVSEKLSETNYASWAVAVELYVEGHDKLDILHGTKVKPDEKDPSFRTWRRDNIQLMTWMLNSVNSGIKQVILHNKTAYDMWKTLEQMYGRRHDMLRTSRDDRRQVVDVSVLLNPVFYCVTIKVCIYDDTGPVRTEEKTLYTEDDFHDFLSHRGWMGLRELSSFKNVDSLNELHPGAMYQGVRLLSD
ncbi:hypothetical protein ZIOFF_034230 [Zingiber officinale]|uniref:Myb-like domain-containing protein n=1 Tax=Zingiber officinale TaxID=94328 RepID=A0A8J5GRP2_ZINOF|nr:hypothetical protein ZIOFF_034230 [Zingiber officinale]